MTKPKKHSRGGGVLLEKYGPDYFKKLKEKQTEKHRKAIKLWEKTQKEKVLKKKKSVKSVRVVV